LALFALLFYKKFEEQTIAIVSRSNKIAMRMITTTTLRSVRRAH